MTPKFGQSVASVMECLERSVEKDQCLIVLPISDYLRKLEMKGRELVEVKATSRTSIASDMSVAVVYVEVGALARYSSIMPSPFSYHT